MKKYLILLISIAISGSVHADIYAAPYVGYGIAGKGANGGIVDPIPGTVIALQILDGGGDGLDYSLAGPLVPYWDGSFQFFGNDSLIGLIETTVTSTPGADFSDYGTTISGLVGGFGTPWASDTWVRVSGINHGDWVWEAPISFFDGDYSDPKTLPEQIDIDGSKLVSADGTVTIQVPEPSTIGLMGLSGFGLYLARRKTRGHQRVMRLQNDRRFHAVDDFS